MKISKGLRFFVEESKKSDSYWVESAKLQFALALERQRQAAEMTYVAIAQKIGTSAAYITKVFRGDSNMTIESMVKLARATGGHLEVQIVNSAATEAKWHIDAIRSKTKQQITASSIVAEGAVNDEKFALAA